MAQPSGASTTSSSTLPVQSMFGSFGQPSHSSISLLSNMNSVATTPTPASIASSSDNTYVMPNSPLRKQLSMDGYRPKVIRTVGQRPACLVNASVTYCGNNHIYAFGGFDQYTDEVYNHVLRLDLGNMEWSLVDNYGDIPGVRMGHTATLYQGNKLLVFGGENEHRTYLSDLIIFDLKTAHWTQPQVSGPIPRGRARHAAVLHQDKLFIIGGIRGHDQYVLDDICFLDLKTFTWSKSWRFAGRYDHSAYIWGDRVWLFGGLGEDMDKVNDLWWLDLKGSPAFESPPQIGSLGRNNVQRSLSSRPSATASGAVGTSGYAANSRTAQISSSSFHAHSYVPPAPGSVSALRFVSGSNTPPQSQGTHFHVFSAGTLLDFATPAATISTKDRALSVLDLATLRWQKLASGKEIFKSGYRWHFCTLNEDGTKAWLLGSPTEPTAADVGLNREAYLSDIIEIDLRKYGFLGDKLSPERRRDLSHASSLSCLRSRSVEQPSQGLGGDLAKLFDKPPDTGSGTDFIITALPVKSDEDDMMMGSAVVLSAEAGDDGRQTWIASTDTTTTSPPIHVHRLILHARWPHFARLWASQMAEFHTKKMHIPEPYSVVRTFLYYLYTDQIDPHPVYADVDADVDASSPHAALSDVAGLLVMSNIYNMPHLRLLCVNRLSRELDVDHACVIWYSAGLAHEEWLRKRAAQFCLTHWGRIVRTAGFLNLPRTALVELSQEIDTDGRVINGDEVDMLACEGPFVHADHAAAASRNESISSSQSQPMDGELEDEDEGMEL